LKTLNVEYRKVEALIPYARNPRTHSEAQVAKIAASIVEFGWTNPVLVDGENGVIAGHGRLAAARKLGLIEVPVIELAHLSPNQKRAYVISDNRLALDAGWDEELLGLELAELTDAGFDLALTGFDDVELDTMFGAPSATDSDGDDPDDGEDVADDVPPTPVDAISRTGDVWALGQHRLTCGDATDQSVVAALMQGDKATLCFTSPPYGNQRDYTSGGITDWDGLMRGVFAKQPVTDDAQVLVNLGLIHRDNEVVPYWDGWLSWMGTQEWRRFAWYVWDQGPGMPGDWSGRLAPSFEFVFHFNRQSRTPNKIVPCKHAGEESHLRADGSSTAMRSKEGEVGGWAHKGQPTQDSKIPDSVIRVMRHKGKIGQDIDHPAVFPVGLPEFILEAYSSTGDIVYEPFGGSGTTMLAAQRSGLAVVLDHAWASLVKVDLDAHLAACAVVGVGDLCVDRFHLLVSVWCCDASMNALFQMEAKLNLQEDKQMFEISNGNLDTCLCPPQGGHRHRCAQGHSHWPRHARS